MRIPEAIAAATTVFERSLRPVSVYPGRLLKPASVNAKLGGGSWTTRFRAGSPEHRGNPLFSLTLAERETCDPGCEAWALCYGNHMPFAHRIVVDDEDLFEARLADEVRALARKHPGGFSVRLHVLGDFYSTRYVQFWGRLLAATPQLNVYGYTHRRGEIALALDALWAFWGSRFTILQSDGGTESIRPVALLETTPGADQLPTCPEQTGKAASCLDCGLCTIAGIRGVRFLIH